MTTLTAEQFAIVVRELDLMLADGEHDEFWRVVKMFADNRFNFSVKDFSAVVQAEFASLGLNRRKEYAVLLEQFHQICRTSGPLANESNDGTRAACPTKPTTATGTVALQPVFEAHEIGNFHHDGKSYPLLKLVSHPSSSPYAVQVPICLVAGVHGDEPDGILAALEFARRFSRTPQLISNYALTIYPCVNPVGYERMTRENGHGKDLNREFFRDSREGEVVLLEAELRAHEFTGFIGGHSDYESFGLYAYATGAVLSERLAKPALFQASGVIPINTDAVIDGHPAQHGIINQKFPGSLGPLTKGASEPFDITIETPNLFALSKRVDAQAIAFETILHEYRAVASEAMYL